MTEEIKCSYCKDDMKYGKDYKVSALIWDICLEDKEHPLMKMSLGRNVCYPCLSRMLDYLARESGCVK